MQVFKSPLSDEEFSAILDKYDDSEDTGLPFTEFETGGELMKMFINVTAPEVPPDSGSDIDNGGNNGNSGDDNNVIYPPPPDPDSGDSGKERPLPNG